MNEYTEIVDGGVRYYRLLQDRQSRFVFEVLCGGVGMFEVKVLLSEDERQAYAERGKDHLDELAYSIARRHEEWKDRIIE